MNYVRCNTVSEGFHVWHTLQANKRYDKSFHVDFGCPVCLAIR